jgi:hypothetical protein
MAYYVANLDVDGVICDACGDARWDTHPKYGTNVDARLAEADRTGVRWSWVPRWSTDPVKCDNCGQPTR